MVVTHLCLRLPWIPSIRLVSLWPDYMDIAVCAMIDGMGKPHQPAHYQTIFLRLLQISISITSHSQFSNTLLVPMHCTVIRERRKSGQSNPPKINWGKNYVSQALSL